MIFDGSLALLPAKRLEVGARGTLRVSLPPKNDSLWLIAQKHGFEVIVQGSGNAANKGEKRIDTGIATDITADSILELMNPEVDTITLVSGDVVTTVPTVERLRKRGLKF